MMSDSWRPMEVGRTILLFLTDSASKIIHTNKNNTFGSLKKRERFENAYVGRERARQM